jgi:uncharacterized protein YneF (UPF0154 family)
LSKDILPSESQSDYSLPGRFEDGNSVYFKARSEKPKPRNIGIWILVIALVIVASGSFSYYFINQSQIDSQIIQNMRNDPEKKLVSQYGVGEYGSEHSHAAIVFFVNGEILNFSMPQFQLLSKYIHLENHNPHILHKHATGAPLEMLFASMGIRVSQDCMVLNYYESSEIKNGMFCSEQEKSLRVYLNGKQFSSDVSQYVFEHNDRILISFGNIDSISEQLEYLESLRIFDVPKKIPRYSGDGITI